MSAPPHVQANWAEFSSATSGSVTLSSGVSGADVTAGNTLAAIAINVGTSNRQVASFSDDNSGTWNIDQSWGNTFYSSFVGSADDVDGGATQITANWNFSTSFVLQAVEFSDANSTDAYDSGDTNDDTTSDTDDECAASLTTSADVYVLAGGVNNGSHSGLSAPAGWTMLRTGTHNSRPYAIAYISSDSGLSADNVTFTHTGSNRTWRGSVAAYIAAGGGGPTYTLECTAGSYSAAGQQANLVASRQVIASAGSYAITGQNADLLATRSVVATSGSHAVAGLDADLICSRVLVGTAGVYAVTGQSTDLTVAKTLAVTAGTYSITGANVELVCSRMLVCTAGSYAVTGHAVDLVPSAADYTLTCTAGSYSISGQDADLVASRVISATDESYAITGQDAAFLVTRSLIVTTGVYSITGQTTGLFTSRVITATAGSYAISGQTVSLTYSGDDGSLIPAYYNYLLGA